MRNIIFIVITSLTILTSCYYAQYPQTGSNFYTETLPKTIKIYTGDIEQEYVIIGSVTVNAIGDADDAVKHLKKKASKIGADAIIKVELNILSTSSLHTGISGIAVKLRNS